jgi:ABC-2 type transport system permease protein
LNHRDGCVAECAPEHDLKPRHRRHQRFLQKAHAGLSADNELYVLPLFFFSSALFPVPDLPGAVWFAVRLNPLSYGVDGMRGALSDGFVFGIATDFAVLGLLAAILLAIGAYLFSKIEV